VVAQHVGGEGDLVALGRGGVPRGPDACVGDEDVDSAVAPYFAKLIRRGPHGAQVRQVERDEIRDPVRFGLDPLERIARLDLVTCGDDDLGATMGEPEADLETDAGVAAGDEREPSVEPGLGEAVSRIARRMAWSWTVDTPCGTLFPPTYWRFAGLVSTG
jgi:hypothetical protein